MDHAQEEKKAFRKFLFYQNIICFDWVMNFFLSSVMFSVKVSFPAKTAVGIAIKKLQTAATKLVQSSE